jgi:hypothetical protein
MEIPPTGQPPELGSFCTIGSSSHAPVGPRPAGNWVRFAQSVIEELGSFCAFTLRRPPSAGEIGFVLHVSLPGRGTPHRPNAFAYIPQSPQLWLRFARFPPHPPAAGPNWVRFAQSPRAGPRRQAAGQASHRKSVPIPNPQFAVEILGSFCTPSSLKCEVCRLKPEGGMPGPSDLKRQTSNLTLVLLQAFPAPALPGHDA